MEASRAGAASWTPAQTNQSLHTGDKLRTGLRSRATMRLSDLSVVRVDQLTALEIQAPLSAGKPPVMNQKGGSIYFFNREKPADVQFRTPVASGAILGTEFHLTVGPDGKTVLTLLDGVVNLSNPQGELHLRSGEQGTVELGQAPRKTAMIDAVNILQWSLYYPGVLHPEELNLDAGVKLAVGDSLTAYRSGDLLAALAAYPDGRQPASDAERTYLAALLLSVGRAEEAEATLNGLQSPAPSAVALRKLIAAVKNLNVEASTAPTTATEWMAESYYLQSKSRLERALAAAQSAARTAPESGFAWVRVAELEFGFGRTGAAQEALNKGLKLSPRHAEALSLTGFLLAAQNRTGDAIAAFDQAIAVDGALGNAWLGRGLCRIRQGQGEAGRRDLQVAATLEPQRAVLRSYLGKAFSYTSDEARAEKELTRARELDPNDPTSWLYSALLNQQRNRVNDAVGQLEKSKELNDNRSVYRSRLLLDQDKAVRSANLAAIYRDAGMTDVSVREASRAVNDDYGSYSAHQFLANSYDALRDPKLINLRYETAWFSELLVANLLTPVGAGNLSQTISQQEYSRFFEGNRVGIASGTEYYSSGDWSQYGSQYGVAGNTSYAVDAYYRSENGQRVNNDFTRLELAGRFKQQITPQDSVLLDIRYFNYKSGDVTQYYNQDGSIATQPAPSATLRVKERQDPNLFLGYHHEWAPGVHTLFLGGRLSDNFSLNDPVTSALYLQTNAAGPVRLVPTEAAFGASFQRTFQSDLEAYSVELQQIWQTPRHTLVAGARYQTGSSDTFSEQFNELNYPPPLGPLVFATNVTTELNRFTIYGYHQWQVHDTLRLTAGVSYDRLEYPENIDTPPINGRQLTRDQVSPKAGVLWAPGPETHVRGAFTRSLGGVFYDQSIRLEPTQVAGFNQAFRSISPEAVAGLVPGSRFETFGVGVDHTFKTRTYVSLEGEILKSEADRVVGVLTGISPFLLTLAGPSGTRQTLDYKEKSATVTMNQLVSQEWSLGARYRISEAEFVRQFVELPGTIPSVAVQNLNVSGKLHQLDLFAIYTHPSGFFSQFHTIWSKQHNSGYTPSLVDEDFWQFNLYAGYRFLRRQAEVRVGLLNVFDRNYRLNPVNLYSELPRERTLTASLRFYF